MFRGEKKHYRENQNALFIVNTFFFCENLVIYDIMWQNTVQADSSQTWTQYGAENMRFARRRTKAWTRHTHTHNIIFNSHCLPRRQWLRERVWIPLYMCTVRLLNFYDTISCRSFSRFCKDSTRIWKDLAETCSKLFCKITNQQEQNYN